MKEGELDLPEWGSKGCFRILEGMNKMQKDKTKIVKKKVKTMNNDIFKVTLISLLSIMIAITSINMTLIQEFHYLILITIFGTLCVFIIIYEYFKRRGFNIFKELKKELSKT